MVKNAAGYIRCSTEMQEDSPEQQKKEIHLFAMNHHIEIVGWFIDFGKSGTTFDQRPEFLRLKQVVEGKPNFQVVICYDESRWGRAIDAEENTYWKVYFRKRGVDVLLVKTSVDRNNEYAPMLSAFEGAQASQFSKKLSELTLRGAKNNGVYSSGGTAPYGYKRIAVSNRTGVERELTDGEWCVHGQEKVRWGIGVKEEVEVVRHIFERRVEGLAYVLIAQDLNKRGIPCPQRGRWKNRDRKWSSVTIKTIIENPSYYGARIYNRYSSSRIVAKQKGRQVSYKSTYQHWRNDPDEWSTMEGAHAAIVDRELWDTANNVKHKNIKRSNNGHTYRSRYLLTGLIRCSSCGFSFQGWSGNVHGKSYYKYVDGGWVNKRICSFLGIGKDLLEEFALQAIKETMSDPSIIKRITEELQTLIQSEPDKISAEGEKLRQLIQNNDDKIKNLTEAIESGIGSETIFQRLKELEDEQITLKTRLQSLKPTVIEPSRIDAILKEVTDFIQNFDVRIKNVPIEEQKILIKKVISRITVDREKEVVNFYVRSLPLVHPVIEELIENKQAPFELMSTPSARSRT